MGVKEQLKDFSNKLDANFVDPLVDKIMNSDFDFVIPPPNLMISEKFWKENVRSELKKLFLFEDMFSRFESGFKAISKHFSLLAPVEQKKIQQEWLEGIDHLTDSYETKESKGEDPEIETEPNVPMLDQIMRLSEETIQFFYKSGTQLYQQQDYQKASDVFLILTMLNIGQHDFWMGFGVSEQQLGHFEAAMHGFSMAAITQIDSPYPYISLAECCIRISNSAEALIYIDIAIEKLNSSQDAENKGLLFQINLLKNECKK